MYTEIVLECERALADALSDALIDCGALAATIEDAQAGSDAEVPLYGEPGLETGDSAWAQSRIVALFAEGADADALSAAAQRNAGVKTALRQSVRSVADEDWVRLTQSQFEPIAISHTLYIVPSWHVRPALAGADATLIELDPGLAFGTGSHATTRLCLQWLETTGARNKVVVDYGSGSGILAIAAAKLGASRVIATDIDPQALAATRSNAAINHVDIEIESSVSFSVKQADIVIANILSNPLKLLAPLLSGLVAPGGYLAVSGVLERQVNEVKAVYSELLPLDVWNVSDGWACLYGQAQGS
jgi:ribosomal protein L11 methyltransferase